MVIILLKILVVTLLEPSQAVIPWPALVAVCVGVFGSGFIVAKYVGRMNSKPSIETRKIVILGFKGCGKSTMWKLLKGENPKEGDEESATGMEEIESFHVMSSSGKEMKIEASMDYGGGDKWVSLYDEIIEKDTFIYFLVRLDTIEAMKKSINERLRKIVSIHIDKHNSLGIKIVATHLDKTNYSKTEAIEKVANTINVNYYRKGKITALNLFDKQAFDKLKDEIINAGIPL